MWCCQWLPHACRCIVAPLWWWMAEWGKRENSDSLGLLHQHYVKVTFIIISFDSSALAVSVLVKAKVRLTSAADVWRLTASPGTYANQEVLSRWCLSYRSMEADMLHGVIIPCVSHLVASAWASKLISCEINNIPFSFFYFIVIIMIF